MFAVDGGARRGADSMQLCGSLVNARGHHQPGSWVHMQEHQTSRQCDGLTVYRILYALFEFVHLYSVSLVRIYGGITATFLGANKAVRDESKHERVRVEHTLDVRACQGERTDHHVPSGQLPDRVVIGVSMAVRRF